ncbi:MAG: hypothetical protein ABWY05_08055 [Noviherbaspirillum sp.]
MLHRAASARWLLELLIATLSVLKWIFELHLAARLYFVTRECSQFRTSGVPANPFLHQRNQHA